MPHLSPMNWLLVPLFTWCTILMVVSTLYFLPAMKYESPKLSISPLSNMLWHWNLQDGRDKL